MSIVSLLSDLIAFPTVSKQLNPSQNCLDYAEHFLTQRSMDIKRHDNNGFPSLVATTHQTKAPKVLLQAHIDVVPAPKKMYAMSERHGRFHGRGVFDMKFAAACYLQLVDDLQPELDDYDFGIMLTSDEEIGGEDGVGYLLEQGYSAGVCILPDGGDAWEIENANNGVWHVRLVAAGKTAHGSRPWEGVNAIESLARAVLEIRDTFGEHHFTRSSITVSQISGGVAINQVPATAEATLDMRFIDTEDYTLKRASVERILKAGKIELRELSQEDPGKIDLTEPAIADFIKIAEHIRGKPLGQTRSCGSSDARFFRAKGIPTILIRPSGGGAHGDDEWIDKTELLQFYEVIKAYVKEAAKVA